MEISHIHLDAFRSLYPQAHTQGVGAYVETHIFHVLVRQAEIGVSAIRHWPAHGR